MLLQPGRRKLSETGLLAPDNCVVTLIDLQPQMHFDVSTFDRQSIINNNLILAKAMSVFDVPVVLSTVETKSFSSNMRPQIETVFPRAGAIRAYIDERLGRSEFRRRHRKERAKEDRLGGALDRDLRRAADHTGHSQVRVHHGARIPAP
jgi:hypothetical protein